MTVSASHHTFILFEEEQIYMQAIRTGALALNV
jgi:hypothetical protein